MDKAYWYGRHFVVPQHAHEAACAEMVRDEVVHDLYETDRSQREIDQRLAVVHDHLRRAVHGAPGSGYHESVCTPQEFHAALVSGGMNPTYAACAAENAARFSRNAVPGQESVLPFEEIIGVPPIFWPAFAEAHRAAFTTA